MIIKTSRWLLVLCLVLSVLSALAVIGARIALPKLTEFEVYISKNLSERLNAEISIENIDASWLSVNPKFTINNIKIVDSKHNSRRISIDSIYGNLDIGESIKNFAPIFEQLNIDGLRVDANQQKQRWLTVFSPPAQTDTKSPESKKSNSFDSSALNRLLNIVAKQSQVKFSNVTLRLKPENLPSRVIGPMQLLMDNSAKMHQLSGTAQLKSYGDNSTVSFAVQAEQLSETIIETPYQVYANFENITEQFFDFNVINTGIKIDKLALSSEVWATLTNGVVSDVTGALSIDSLSFEDSKLPKLVNSSLEFRAIREQHKQRFLLSKIDLSDGEHLLNIPHASVTYDFEKGYIQRIALASLDFGDLKNAFLNKILQGTKVEAALSTLNLEGAASNLLLTWKDNKWTEFSLQADLDRVSIDSYKGAPAMAGVSGLLTMSALQGSVDLASEDFSMYFPDLFSDRWSYEKAKGKVSWSVEKQFEKIKQVNVFSELLTLNDGEQLVNGRFSLVLPLSKIKPSELILMIGGQNLVLDSALSYIPNKVVLKSLKDWIEKAAVKGSVRQGAVVIRTPLKRIGGVNLNPSVQLDFKLDKAQAAFSDDWPHYLADDLRVTVDNNDITAFSSNGMLAKNHVIDLKISKPSSKNSLSVDGVISGDLKKLVQQIKTKKSYQQLSKPIQALAISGKHSSVVKLSIPLPTNTQKSANAKSVSDAALMINVKSDIASGKLIDQQSNLTLSAISGRLEFDNIKGLKAKKLKAQLFDQPANVSIISAAVENALKTSISLNGTIASKSISNWVDASYLKSLSGKSNYSARLDLCIPSANCNQLVINSDLLGMAVNLPAPWGKTEKQQAKFQIVQNGAENKGSIWRYNYKDIVRGITQVNSSAITDANKKNSDSSDKVALRVRNAATHIVLGGARPELVSKQGVRVSGQLVGLDLDKLVGEYTGMQKSTRGEDKKAAGGSNDVLAVINNVDLKLRKVRFLGQYLPTGWINLQASTKNWFGQFDVGMAAGQINYSPKKGSVTELRLNKLILKTNDTAKKGSSKSSYSTKDTSQWPDVALTIDSLLLNSLDIGRWSAHLAPTKSGYGVSSIKGKIAQTDVGGEMVWVNQKGAVKSVVDVFVKGGDFGAVLKQFGQSRVLENKSGAIKARLSWPGNPWDFEQGKLDGTFEFDIKNGRIIEAGTSASFLRIFGILNLNTVIKRLKLDFSDLLKSGVAFDKVTAKYQLKNGLAKSVAPLKLEGDAASIEMKGTINLKDGALANRMQVAIPLTSNAPIAALFLATPQVAGIAFVIDKILGKRLSKLTALSYDISGTLLDPIIKPVAR